MGGALFISIWDFIFEISKLHLPTTTIMKYDTQTVATTAINEAMKSPMAKKYGAVLVHNGKIVSKGYNHYKLNKMGADSKSRRRVFCVHAEQACICSCRNKSILSKSTLVLVTWKHTGRVAVCEPCSMCSDIIDKYKIKTVVVYYGRVCRSNKYYDM